MRYSQDTNTTPLTLESPAQPSPVINLYPPGQTTVFNTTPAFSPEGGAFYPPASHLFSSLDVRSRLGSNSTSSTGMAHAHRSTALPQPGAQINTRDIYTPATPSFNRRPPDHTSRSPSFPGTLRRHPLSPTPSPNLGFTNPLRMDPTFVTKPGQNTIPPLQPTNTLGNLQYADGTPIKVEVNGTIDKGFFLAEGEWTCYRRNYFSCVCSYALTPNYPNTAIQFVQNAQNGTPATYNVLGFSMCISAVVADNDGHAIDLVQHTPKRDKGPIARPEKIRLHPKPSQSTHHPAIGMYGQADSGMSMSSRYDQAYGQPQGASPTEHTFERIQFKQATANNGKRRAAQQYYHLMVELWADVGGQGSDQFVKVAYRKSAKMIVRGRSPGHYQAERRGSASSGPGGSAGSLGYGGSQVLGSDFGSGSGMVSGTYPGYDPRPAHQYNTSTRQHHDLPMETVMSAEEAKAIHDTKDYQYYPAPMYEGNQDPRQPVEMFSHQRNDHDGAIPPLGSSGLEMSSKVKHEYEGNLPSLFYPGPSFYTNRCGRFEGKSSSSGYYPTSMPPQTSSSLNMMT